MSGIAAILNLKGNRLSTIDIERLANVLRDYGPDRKKVVVRKDCAFVFCLHQLNPEDIFDYQPITLANRFVVLFDGRIDNRCELAKDLGIDAAALRTMPDSRLFCCSFDRYGERSFERVDGVFAAIIVDLKESRIVCVRDQMGLRVLHYHRSAEFFSVATTPEALFALSWVPRILNKNKIADTLVSRGLKAETTLYEGIYRVGPGSVIRAQGNKFSMHKFWDPENISEVRFKRDQDYVDAFRERLQDAVRVRLRSCKSPCASMSGGFDSSSIAVIASNILSASGKALDTFTAVPEAGFTKQNIPGRYFDETHFVHKIAKANGNLRPHFVPPSNEPLLAQIAELIRLGAAPSAGVANDLWGMDIFRAAQLNGHNVMLSGEVGNVTISYRGEAVFVELLLAGRWLKLARELRLSGHRWKHMLRHWTIAPCIPAPIFRRYKRWRRQGRPPWESFSAIREDFAAQSGVFDRAAQEYCPFDAAPPRDGRWGRINHFHGYSDTADWFAQIRAKFGIDIRTPALDRRVVEFCIGIPHDQYWRDGCDRWLIKRAMRGQLPDEILCRNSYGAQAADWFPRLARYRGDLIAEVKRLEGNSEVASMIDLDKLSGLLEAWPDKEPSDSSPELSAYRWTLPQALGVARFVENVSGANVGR